MARSRRRRERLSRKRRAAPGTMPGTLTIDPAAPPPQIHVIAYGPDGVHEEDVRDPDRLPELLGRWPMVWVNVDGLGDAGLLGQLGRVFDLHPLAMEDVVNVHQRPKLEPYERQQYLVVRMATPGEGLRTEQFSLFLGPGYVVTFQETRGDCFDPVRERIRTGQGPIRRHGSDYLTYALVDAIVDQFFPILDGLQDRLLQLEEEAVVRASPHTPAIVYELKRELLTIRRAVQPLREVLDRLSRGDVPPVTREAMLYFRDALDHAHQLLEVLDACRETAASLMDLYMHGVSQRMNEVMKVLTIIATIFIPLSFIAGVYGMNFDPQGSPWNMPELRWRFGYPFALLLMGAVAFGLLLYFRRKGWLGGEPGSLALAAPASDPVEAASGRPSRELRVPPPAPPAGPGGR